MRRRDEYVEREGIRVSRSAPAVPPQLRAVRKRNVVGRVAGVKVDGQIDDVRSAVARPGSCNSVVKIVAYAMYIIQFEDRPALDRSEPAEAMISDIAVRGVAKVR